MADKLNDGDIVNELKRFGETVKVPIDRKKRPILIKKLNHYYAKENPPSKRGKSGNRPVKPQHKPAEFSDDSQDDDSEFESRRTRKNISGRNSTAHNSATRIPPRKQRDKTHDNGATGSNLSRSSLRSRSSTAKSKTSNTRQVEIFPNEFSDNDTAEESVYEVEEQSIGINTTMNYEDDDEDDDEDSIDEQAVYSKTSTRLSTPNNKAMDSNISTISPPTYSGRGNVNRKAGTKVNGNEHFISKTILTVMGIFFVILAVGYVYVKRDFFLPRQAADFQRDHKTFVDGENNYTKEQVDQALSNVKKLHEQLAKLKGRYELGEIDETEAQMSKDKASIFIVDKGTPNETDFDMMDLCLRLIIRFQDWNILALTEDGSTAGSADDVFYLEGMYGDLPLATRITLALYKVLYGLCLLAVCIFIGVLGIFYLRWQNKKKEKTQQKVYELVEKIIEMLKDNFEMSERKNDNKNYPPYMAVQHIRDQLIPVAKRRPMQPLWEDAVQFIESNESRIRVETQVIQGEEFMVWRWLQAMPNGHKMWQGQAFGETSQGSANSLPYGPTPCLKVRNMFDANMEQSVDDWHLDIEEGILEKCQDNHGILHIFVDRTSREGCVYIKCSSCEKAYEAYQALHGWWFDGRLVTVKYLRLEHYHDRFPDSRNKRHPLKPSKCEMPSVSRPYHKSALEMT